jgi:hypothetical protein
LPPLSRLIRWELVQELKILGRHYPLYLATGAPQHVAHQFAQTLDLFGDVFSTKPAQSDGGVVNFVGLAKGFFLKNRFPSGFIYIGNSFQDIPVWHWAAGCVVVSKNPLLKLILLQTIQRPKPLIFWKKPRPKA